MGKVREIGKANSESEEMMDWLTKLIASYHCAYHLVGFVDGDKKLFVQQRLHDWRKFPFIATFEATLNVASY